MKSSTRESHHESSRDLDRLFNPRSVVVVGAQLYCIYLPLVGK